MHRRNQSTSTLRTLRTTESVEALVSVADERQTGGVLILSRLCSLCPVGSAVVVLVNLVNGEVLCVDVGLKLRLKWCANASETIPRDTAEERMLLDLAGTADAAQTVVSVADQAKGTNISYGPVSKEARELTVSRNPPPLHRVAGPVGSAGCAANPRSCDTCREALPRRTVASR